MRWQFVVCVLLSSGCSFVLTKGPGAVKPGTDPAKVNCTTSGLVPSLDALAGAGMIAASAGGTLYEYVSDNNDFKNFKYYYALPLLAVGIAYLWGASYGTDHVEACTEFKDKAGQPSRWQIQPIDGANVPAKDDERPATLDDVTP